METYVTTNFGIATGAAHKIDNDKQHENYRIGQWFARFQ